MQMSMKEALYCLKHGNCSECKIQKSPAGDDENCGELAARIGAAAIEELIRQNKRIKYVEVTKNE